MKKLKSVLFGTLLSILLSSNLLGDCSFELFSISSTKGTKIIDFVEQLSDECEFTIIITDPNAEEFLNSSLNKTHLKNLTIDEVFNIILNENNLSYTLENNILKISYLTTKVFAIDYILSTRKSIGSTDITLSSSDESKGGGQGAGGTSDAQTESGIKIESTDEVKFWEALDLEFQNVLNRPHDVYQAGLPIINKNAGLVTVTATIKQMNRFEKYLQRLQKKVQLQVLIDVQILLVTMKEGSSTGIDWEQLYKLQNISLAAQYISKANVPEWTAPATITATGTQAANSAHFFSATGEATLSEVIKFLKTQGDVSTLSNPKVLTLNNQPALITVGTELFYKLKNTEILASTTNATQSEGEKIKSVFSGVLLDITPEISEDRMITLKINPSISEVSGIIPRDPVTGEAIMPPDLNRRQLSSVVTVKDGKRIILGGLISVNDTVDSRQIPLLGSIPILGWLFKYEEKSKITEELVIIIEPHIIDKDNSKLSLKDLGYEGIPNEILSKIEPENEELVDAK